MKQVYLSYNPYTLETDIRVQDYVFAENSRLADKCRPDTRLQSWVDDLPGLLRDELNDREFELTFRGTRMDYEDLKDACDKAAAGVGVTVHITPDLAEGCADMEQRIVALFKKIEESDYGELKTDAVRSAFRDALGEDVKICVTATVSAGKSTLINAFLGQQLMPSGEEACTAIITQLRDSDGKTWCGEAFDSKGDSIRRLNPIDHDGMCALNKAPDVAEIRAEGNIPFVEATETKLVLIDTPGPNNARIPEHRRRTQRFMKKDAKTLVLYVLPPTFGTDDDHALLEAISASMKANGRQSRDRFIFVFSKVDARGKHDASLDESLARVREYLDSTYGIEEAHLMPVAALPALLIRCRQRGDDLDEDDLDACDLLIRKLNRNETLHCERYIADQLPSGERSLIETELRDALGQGNGARAALIHTGVPSIEAYIRQYVKKYARTAKIKALADNIQGAVEADKTMETLKQKIRSSREVAAEIAETIVKLQRNLQDGQEAAKMNEVFEVRVSACVREAKEAIEACGESYIANYRKALDKYARRWRIDASELDACMDAIRQAASREEERYRVRLDNIFGDTLRDTCMGLVQEYRQRLDSLASDFNGEGMNDRFTIEPLKLMGQSVTMALEGLHQRFANGEGLKTRTYLNAMELKWYNPLSWFSQIRARLTDDYETEKFYSGRDIHEKVMVPVERCLQENAQLAEASVEEQAKQFLAAFRKEINHLDELLRDKLKELQDCAAARENTEAEQRRSEEHLKWLEEVQGELKNILTI